MRFWLPACLAAFVPACERAPAPDELRRREEALHEIDPVLGLFYEVLVPPDVDVGSLVEDGFGLYPSAAEHEEEGPEGAWWVVHMDAAAAERLRDLGLEPTLALREALPDETAEAIEQTEVTAYSNPAFAAVLPSGPGPMAPIAGCTAIADTFCKYRNADAGSGVNCTGGIEEQLQALANQASYASIAAFVEVDGLTTVEGHRLVGIRIGRQTGTDVPQLLVVAGSHANEWAGPGLALQLARNMLAAYRSALDGSPGADKILKRALDRGAVLIVPVANPDGFAYTFSATAGSRDWKKTRRRCTEEAPVGACGGGVTCAPGQACILAQCYPITGVDLDRNFPFNWRDTGTTCLSSVYEGPSGGSETERTLLDRMFLDSGLKADGQTQPQQYRTRFVVEYGALGNYVLYPDGITDGADGAVHSPCRTGLQQENCQPPEYGLLRWLGGTEAAPQLRDSDPSTGAPTTPYHTDTILRSLATQVGDPPEPLRVRQRDLRRPARARIRRGAHLLGGRLPRRVHAVEPVDRPRVAERRLRPATRREPGGRHQRGRRPQGAVDRPAHGASDPSVARRRRRGTRLGLRPPAVLDRPGPRDRGRRHHASGRLRRGLHELVGDGRDPVHHLPLDAHQPLPVPADGPDLPANRP